MGSAIEQDRSHLDEKVEYAGERVRVADETRSTSSTRQAGRNDGLHFLMKKLKTFQKYTNTNQNCWDQK